MRELWVKLDSRRYPILIGRGLLGRLAAYLPVPTSMATLLLVSNRTVQGLYGATVEESLAAAGYRYGWALVPDGEEAKTLDVLGSLYDRAVDLGLDRSSAVLALGGGVVGDVAGVLAATYMRGIAFVQLPTTLLALVDSSIGGKVAINHPRGKNLIGAFYQPRLVLADLDTLATLPAREWRCGLAEVVKYGVIWDAGLFGLLEERASLLAAYAREQGQANRAVGDPGRMAALGEEVADLLEEIVWRCCRIKAEVVARDEREEEGLRSVLNFGHTVGHAVEALTDYRRYRHGEAVAMGMVAAGRLAAVLGLWSPEEAVRLEALLDRLGLPLRLPADLAAQDLLEAMTRDKKAVGGVLAMVLPRRLGEVVLQRGVAARDVLAVLEECREKNGPRS